jgi:hypothetical protein
MKSPQSIFSRKRSTCPDGSVRPAAADRRAHEPLAQRRPVLLAYLDAWRAAAIDVEASSRRWRSATREERAGAALAFFAALEREEKAATAYQLAWEA